MFGRKERLKKLAESSCKPKEKPQFMVDGEIVHTSEHGNEVVDGMLVMTNHRMLVVKKPIIGKKIDSFTYAQVDCVAVEGKEPVSPGEDTPLRILGSCRTVANASRVLERKSCTTATMPIARPGSTCCR